MRVSLGVNSKAYYNAGTYAAPNWLEVDLISDLTVDMNYNRGDSSVRRSRVVTQEQTRLNLGVTGKLRKDTDDTTFTLIQSAFRNNTLNQWMFLDGPRTESGVTGVTYMGRVFNMGEDQNLDDVIFNSFEVAPGAYDETEFPAWVTVVAGVPIFTQID